MTDTEKINILVKEGEGLTVEFKEHFTPRIDEDIVAFSNTRGGVILLGVRNDRTVSWEKLTNDMKGRINSVRRNECIANLFFRMDKVERAGTGKRRMKEAMTEAGMPPPKIRQTGFYTIVFKRHHERLVLSRNKKKVNVLNKKRHVLTTPI